MRLNIEPITLKSRFWNQVKLHGRKTFEALMKTIQVEGFHPRYFKK